MGRTLFLPTSFKIVAAAVAAFLVWGLVLAYASSPAHAASTYAVDRTDDPDLSTTPTAGACTAAANDCSLRGAITAANANAGDDTIDLLEVSGTVNLTGALPDLSSNIEIKGPGADKLTVRRDTGGDYRIFTITGDTTVVTISGITISNGKVNENLGGGILNFGTLTVSDSTISDNSAPSTGTSGPVGFGGGIYTEGTLTVSGSTISDNLARAGGGIASVDADFEPGGTTTTITDSTISGNTGTQAAGGVWNVAGLTVIEFSTITDNTAPTGLGSGVASFADDLTRTEVLSSIIAANTNTDVDSGTFNTFVSKGYNLIGDGNATGAFNQTTDNKGVADPKLDALGSYGGPTQTHRLKPDSPAIDAGPPTDGNPIACPPPSTDQRGLSRPQGAACDIGAFELDRTKPSVSCSVSPSTLRLPANNHKLVTVKASVTVTDNTGGSGANGFTLVSVTSSQDDSGLGPDDVPNDIQGWTPGTADTSGQLRAERYGTNRIYTLTYQGEDKDGNTANCTATVTVSKPTKKG